MKISKTSFENIDEIQSLFEKDSMRGERLAPEMLKAGAAVLVEEQKKESDFMVKTGKLRLIGKRHLKSRSTGALTASIKASRIKQSGMTSSIEIYPHGTDRKGIRNAEKGFIANYGAGHISGYPWMDEANGKVSDKTYEAMLKIWNNDND